MTTISLVQNPNYVKSGRKSYLHCLRKWGSGGKMREIVDAENVDDDTMYLAKIGIGTPAQTMNLDFDTGSSDLWIWSTLTHKHCGTHAIFDSAKSSTFKTSEGATWDITYGDSSYASGIVGLDKISIGGIIVNDQAVELATTLSPSFVSSVGDGLLGLAFGSINTVTPKSVKTLMENMIAQNVLPPGKQLFTSNFAASHENDKSFYTFGCVIDTFGTPVYTPVDCSQGFWNVKSTSAVVNGHVIKRAGNTAIIDTGTTLALLDEKTVKTIYDAIPGAVYSSRES